MKAHIMLSGIIKLWYLSDIKSINTAVNDLTIKEINRLFKEADYVRSILEKI
ncbi:MAG: hypothetical protein ACE5KT_00710 [Methanosarcinales archaeon]